jgi:hypothetical protein
MNLSSQFSADMPFVAAPVAALDPPAAASVALFTIARSA